MAMWLSGSHLVESEVDDLQQISLLALDRTLRDGAHPVGAQIDGCDWRTGCKQLRRELLYLIV